MGSACRQHPADILWIAHHIRGTNSSSYTKGTIMNGIRVALGNGRFTAEGPLWKRPRRLMQPSFQQDSMRDTAGVVTDSWQRRLDRPKHGLPLTVTPRRSNSPTALIRAELAASPDGRGTAGR